MKIEIELLEIRGKLLHAIDTKDELYAMMQVNNIDNLLYAMNEENKALQASTEHSKLNLADVIKRYRLNEDLEQDIASVIELGYKLRNGGIPSASYDEYYELKEMIVDKFL